MKKNDSVDPFANALVGACRLMVSGNGFPLESIPEPMLSSMMWMMGRTALHVFCG